MKKNLKQTDDRQNRGPSKLYTNKLIRFNLFFFSLLSLFLFSSPVLHAEEPVAIDLILEQESIKPGSSFWIAIPFQLEKGWHLYWKNPGDAGVAPVIEWKLPKGYQIIEQLWTTPKKYVAEDLITYGYEEEATLLAEVLVPKTADGEQTIEAEVHWVICNDSSCLPGEALLSKKILIDTSSNQSDKTEHSLFETTRTKIPSKNSQIFAKAEAEKIVLHVPKNGKLLEADFFPENFDLIDHRATIAFKEASDDLDHHQIFLDKKPEALNEKPLKGVVVLTTHDQGKLVNISHAIDLFVGDGLKTNQEGFLFILGIAFLGGILLNLMPCVLPVMSFKILGFVKMAGQNRSQTLKHGIFFSAGVLVSFWILGGVLLSLQSYGHAVGWGFQLQEPYFVAILAGIIFMLALSMFGVFEFGTSVASIAGDAETANKSQGLFHSFFSGILATAVATPCTGPFLGTAIGFAATLPALQSLLIFSSLGLGMAFPYLILSGFPNLLKFLPKPGKWMVTFKEILGFLMLATVLWLVWVFGAETNTLALLSLLFGFFFLSIACWIYGKWGTFAHRKQVRLTSYFFAATFIAVGGYTLFFASTISSPTQEIAMETDSSQNWETFSPERLIALRESGTPVFVDFTAKWCLICQTNHLALSTDSVSQKFKDKGVVKMKADWTKNDPVITKELQKYGRNSVPLYLLYQGDPKEEPTILPQVLTPDVVVQSLKTE